MAAETQRELLRLVTCGSVDDGKSTLLGRMLFDAQLLNDDDLARLGDPPDFSCLLDGLSIEREQGITIDVAYRYISTDKRDFIIADSPGHTQYTRNMATGASQASLALMLVDARKGVLTQTRRHSYICHLLGIRRIVLVINKMDLVDYAEDVGRDIEQDYRVLADSLGLRDVRVIPVSAMSGDNIVNRSSRMPWYEGPTLLDLLESVPVDYASSGTAMRLPVQRVNRAGQDFRGYDGTLVAGKLQRGDKVVVLPSGQYSTIADLYVAGEKADTAVCEQAVTVTLDDDLDVTRGDLLAAADDVPDCADQFAAHVLWMGEKPMLPGRLYALRLASGSAVARITAIKHNVDVDSQERLAATRLDMNEVGYINLSLDHPIAYEPYADNRQLGGFILIDRQTSATVACGTIDFALRRSIARRVRPVCSRHRIVCGLPACLARASPPWPIWLSSNCTPWGGIPSCSTATTFATDSTATWVSPPKTVSKTFAGSPKSPS